MTQGSILKERFSEPSTPRRLRQFNRSSSFWVDRINASFIGFTGTPIDKADANTQETFGGYVSIYDIEDAKEDKATVPIYYERARRP
jgi:type I site-specific restriction-modification system R (restriction) subunit